MRLCRRPCPCLYSPAGDVTDAISARSLEVLQSICRLNNWYRYLLLRVFPNGREVSAS